MPGEGPYAENIEKGIEYVLQHQAPNGMIVHHKSHGPLYCHGISTLMLAEVDITIGDVIIYILAGLVIAAFGLLLRWATALSWAVLAVALATGPMIGEMLDLPQAVRNVSPFTWHEDPSGSRVRLKRRWRST